MKKYTVVAGDTLSRIAETEYGDADLYPVIAASNQLANPDHIEVGQILDIPYVTRRLQVCVVDHPALRQEITQLAYGTTDPATQLMWEIANGVAQHPIENRAWLRMPDLGDEATTYTSPFDQTLTVVAQQFYGDGDLAGVIRAVNGLGSQEVSKGQVLRIPGLNQRVSVGGETIFGICSAQYGSDDDIDTWVQVVAAANNLAFPFTLVSGQTLLMPS